MNMLCFQYRCNQMRQLFRTTHRVLLHIEKKKRYARLRQNVSNNDAIRHLKKLCGGDKIEILLM